MFFKSVTVLLVPGSINWSLDIFADLADWEVLFGCEWLELTMPTPGDGASSCRLVLLVLREVISIYDRKVVNCLFG